MSCFFELPKDVRDIMYLYVIESPIITNLPASTDALQESHIIYPHEFPTPVCSHLFLVCHQVNSEVTTLITHNNKGYQYKLDCMIQGCTIWPIWVEFPTPPKHVQNFEVSIHILSYTSGVFREVGEPGLLWKPLFQLLNQFFHHGPQFFYNGKLKYSMQVNTMSINMTMDGISDKWTKLEIPDTACRFLGNIVEFGFLCGKVGKLTLCANGEVQNEWKIDEVAPVIQQHQQRIDDWVEYGYVWGPTP